MDARPMRIFQREEWIDVPGVGYAVLTGAHYFEDRMGNYVGFSVADPDCRYGCHEGLLMLPEADDTATGWSDVPHLCPCQMPGYVSPTEEQDLTDYHASQLLGFEF